MSLLKKFLGGRRGAPVIQQAEEEGQLREAIADGELERSIADLRAGNADIQPVIEHLVNARLFIPSYQDPDGIQVGKGFKPAVLEFAEGLFVPVFTSAYRAGIVDELKLEFASGIEAEAPWLIRSMPPNIGMYINPGWTTSLMLPPETMSQIREQGLV